MAFKIKQHDTSPSYVVDLQDDFGLSGQAAINLTNATTVTFLMRKKGQVGAPKVSAVMTIVSPASGRVQHDWALTHTDTVAVYDVEFEIAWNDGTIETVPNDSYLAVEVVDDLTD